MAGPALAGRVKRGFEALKIYDYFEAKKQFTKGMKYNAAPSSYGLAIIYSRTDNPFYNRDSADRYIRIAKDLYPNAKEGKKLKWKIYTWHQSGIDSLQQLIGEDYFRLARESHSVNAYTEFINRHSYSNRKWQAVKSRDSLAFFEAVTKNTSEAYANYIATYPQSAYLEIAQENFYDVQFAEITGDGTLESYIQFIEQNPDSPLIAAAQDRIFELMTYDNTAESYEDFLNSHPTNRNTSRAWNELYHICLENYSLQAIESFESEYPGYPSSLNLSKAKILADSILLPYESYEFFGFMNTDGSSVIPAMFSQVSPFQEGLSIVEMDGKFGAIDKSGAFVIPLQFEAMTDFEQGYSLVEKEGKMGLLHRNGRLLIQPTYSELGLLSDGLAYASQNEQYGFVNKHGDWIVNPQYDEAYDFQDGKAMVETMGMVGFIDIEGNYLMKPEHEYIEKFGDSAYVFTREDKQGLIDLSGNVILEDKFDHIGNLSEELAIATYNDTLVYINGKGKVVIEDEFETFPNCLQKGEFVNGAAIAVKDGKYGRINTAGKTITEFEYNNIGMGKDIIPFEKKGSWGAMNLSNRLAISRKFDYMEVMNDSMALVELEDSIGLIDLNGDAIVPLIYEDLVISGDDIVIGQNQNGFHVYSKGLEALEYWDGAKRFDEDFVILEKDGGIIYLEISTGKYIQYQE